VGKSRKKSERKRTKANSLAEVRNQNSTKTRWDRLAVGKIIIAVGLISGALSIWQSLMSPMVFDTKPEVEGCPLCIAFKIQNRSLFAIRDLAWTCEVRRIAGPAGRPELENVQIGSVNEPQILSGGETTTARADMAFPIRFQVGSGTIVISLSYSLLLWSHSKSQVFEAVTDRRGKVVDWVPR
jgi:hypothetical protein